jgi:ATP-binding cassette, subfamily B, heavy metal transporter
MQGLKLFKSVLGYFDHRLRLAVIVFIAILGRVILVIAPLSFKQSVSFLENSAYSSFLTVLLSYVGLRLLGTLCSEVKDALFIIPEQRAVSKICTQMFRHLQHLKFDFHVHRQIGGLVRIIDRGTKGIEIVNRLLVFNLLPTLFEMVCACLVLALLYPAMISTILGVTFLTYWIFTLKVSQMRLSLLKESNQKENHLQSLAMDSLLNSSTVKFFHQEEFEKCRYAESLAGYQKYMWKMRSSLAFLNAGQAIIVSVGLFSLLFFAASLVFQKEMQIADFVMLNVYILQFIMPLHALGFAYREIRQGSHDIKEMLKIKALPQEQDDEVDAKPFIWQKGEVCFEEVTFAYQKESPTLKNCSFVLEAGKVTGIVGSSGEGKSSILNLLVKLIVPQSGRIMIDQQNLNDVQRLSLRQKMGIVPQDIVLFNDTILSNIAYGKPGATTAEIEEAAKKACIHDFILTLSEKYDTLVGERGLRLSGGQKQRIAIARALLKDPLFFIFDEATSALDSVLENTIQKNILEACAGATVLMIAHRLSTLVHADRILVLDQGCVAEQGSHLQLLEKNGLYAALWHQQRYHERSAL